MGQSNTIIAAGGILYRMSGERVQCALVKTARKGAWGIPKGKRKSSDASLLDTAVREVQEETGCLVVPMGFAGQYTYRVGGARKVVVMWHMLAVHDDWCSLEKDILEIDWISPAKALRRLARAEERHFFAQCCYKGSWKSPGNLNDRPFRMSLHNQAIRQPA